MKKIFYSTLISLGALASMTSCGVDLVSKSIPTDGVSKFGNHKQYVNIVGDSCTILYNQQSDDYFEPSITIEFELAEKFTKTKRLDARYGNIDIVFTDANGGEIADVDEFTPELSGYAKLEDLLKNGNVGDRVKVTFNPWIGGMDADDVVAFDKAVASFEVNDLDFSVNLSAVDDDDSDSNSALSSDSGSEDWDEIIDEYEEYVTDYIAVMKKANSGDVSALADAASMMETANSLGRKLGNADGSLSSSQMARYTSVTAKMASAVSAL